MGVIALIATTGPATVYRCRSVFPGEIIDRGNVQEASESEKIVFCLNAPYTIAACCSNQQKKLIFFKCFKQNCGFGCFLFLIGLSENYKGRNWVRQIKAKFKTKCPQSCLFGACSLAGRLPGLLRSLSLLTASISAPQSIFHEVWTPVLQHLAWLSPCPDRSLWRGPHYGQGQLTAEHPFCLEQLRCLISEVC